MIMIAKKLFDWIQIFAFCFSNFIKLWERHGKYQVI